MGADEVGILEALRANRREVVDPAIAEHKGRIVKTTGDGILVEFASAVDAVTCAIAIQEKIEGRSASGAEPRTRFRIGINVGESLSTATTSSVMVLTLRRVSKMSASRAVFTSLAMSLSKSRARLDRSAAALLLFSHRCSLTVSRL